MSVLHSKNAFSEVLEDVASQHFSPAPLAPLHVSVYSAAKLFGCFHFCVVSLQSMARDVVSAIASKVALKQLPITQFSST